MTDLSESTVLMTAIYQHRSSRAVCVKTDENDTAVYWLPFSQLHNVYESSGDETNIVNLDPHETYMFRITTWIACRIFKCDTGEDLAELGLSFLDCE